MQLTSKQLRTIGPTIREVAHAQAQRFYKAEPRNRDRAYFVFKSIRTEIDIALSDLGIDTVTILKEIDPTDIIVEAMRKAGFKIEDLPVD